MSGRSLAAALLLTLAAAPAFAEDLKLPDAKTYDKIVVETLREVHNTGAELFNEWRDYAATYRIYQGSLMTVRPLLAHRPAAQKIIDEGLASAEKDSSMKQRAFKLHETIEGVRTLLKGETPAKSDKEVTKPPVETKKTTDTVPPTTKTPVETKKPAPAYEVAPLPREKKTS
jgi:hypothetical protein